MTPRSHVAVQHGHLPIIFPFSTSWLTSHLICEIFQILLDVYLAYFWNIQVQVSDWIEYSRYMISIWQNKLDIYPLDLYIWHIPDIRLLRNFGGHHVTPYVCNVYHIYLHQVSICHIYGLQNLSAFASRRGSGQAVSSSSSSPLSAGRVGWAVIALHRAWHGPARRRQGHARPCERL